MTYYYDYDYAYYDSANHYVSASIFSSELKEFKPLCLVSCFHFSFYHVSKNNCNPPPPA